MGNEFKRVKEDLNDERGGNEGYLDYFNILRKEVHDLQFIVDHLREDVNCTLEGGKGSLKRIIEREIGVLVYGVLEDSVKKEVQFNETISSLQEENNLLIENGGGMMDELARLTLENESLKNRAEKLESENIIETDAKSADTKGYNTNSIDTRSIRDVNDTLNNKTDIIADGLISSVVELEDSVKIDFLDMIKRNLLKSKLLNESLKIELEDSKRELNFEQERGNKCRSELFDLEKQLNEVQNEMHLLQSTVQDLNVRNAELNNEISSKNEEILRNQEDYGKQIEMERDKEQELNSRINVLENENGKTREELETLNKVMTAQKIELERGKEVLNRERKLSSLKISFLQEQLDEFTSK